MFRKIRFHKPHYFSKHPSRELKGLYWSVGLMDFGMAAVTLFVPIFLFVSGYSLKEIVLFFMMVYGAYIVLIPFLSRLVARIGYEHSIFYSQFFLIAYFLFLFAISKFSLFFYIAPLVFAIQKSLYWPAYHGDFVTFSQKGQRGREVGGVEALSMVMYIIGPLVGGIVLKLTNFSILFIGASVLFILSVLPLLRIKEIHGKVDFSYFGVFKELLDKKHRRNFLAYLGYGEELIVLTIWPIFIYILIKDYLEIGALVAVATLVTSIVVLYLGRASDKYKRENILKIGSIIYFFSWLIRGFAGRAWHVLSLDTVSRFSKEMVYVPLMAMTYGKAKQLGVFSYIVFHEQSVGVAKFLAALLIFIILHFVSSPWLIIFVMAGIFSLFYMFMKGPEEMKSEAGSEQ